MQPFSGGVSIQQGICTTPHPLQHGTHPLQALFCGEKWPVDGATALFV